MPLLCPHCHGPLKANPLGRWLSRFQCPHCRKTLRWSPLTNALGVGGSMLFFVAVNALVIGGEPWTRTLAGGAGILWIMAMGLSYGLRKVVPAPER
jgi:hypothetical protein